MTRLNKLYDQLADEYARDRHLFDTTPMIEWLAAGLPAGRLLDAGCGSGVPVARWFYERGWAVTGVDCSPRMLELARMELPNAEWVAGDMRHVELPAGAYTAVAAVYAVFHLPRREHPALFRRFYEWLKPGGRLLVTLADRHYTGCDVFDGEMEFLGRKLPYSHDLPETAEQHLRDAGFAAVERRGYETGGETFLWMLAEKPAPSPEPGKIADG